VVSEPGGARQRAYIDDGAMMSDIANYRGGIDELHDPLFSFFVIDWLKHIRSRHIEKFTAVAMDCKLGANTKSGTDRIPLTDVRTATNAQIRS
jgi:hypothetical protein